MSQTVASVDRTAAHKRCPLRGLMSEFDERREEMPVQGLDVLVLYTAAQIRELTDKRFHASDTERNPRHPERGLVEFCCRLLDRDPIVKELYRFCSNSGTIIQCSNSWGYDIAKPQTQAQILAKAPPKYDTYYRFITLTGDGFRIADSEKKPTLEAKFEIQPNDASIISFFSKLNRAHAKMAMRAGTTAELILGYLYRRAETLITVDNNSIEKMSRP